MEKPGAGLTYFPALTGLRAIAASLVFLHHYPPFLHFFHHNWPGKLFAEMHIGVSVFFVLSGFLIAFRYGQAVSNSAAFFKPYFLNRFARIYPVFFLATMLSFLWNGYQSWDRFQHIWPKMEQGLLVLLLNITLLKGFFEDLKFSLVGPSWSLTVEECFYLVAPFVLLAAKKSWLYVFAFCLAIVGAGLGLVSLMDLFPGRFAGFFGSFGFMFSYTFFGRCFEFCGGLLLGVLWSRQAYRVEGQAISCTWVGVLGIGFCMVALSLYGTGTHSGDATTEGKLINNLLLPLPVCCLLHGLLLEKTWLSRLLGTSFFQFLGRSSYAFYLFHTGILAMLLQHLPGLPYLVFFAGLWAVSAFIYISFEEPLNQYIRKQIRA